MHKHVFHNDKVLPLAQVRLSPGQAGLLSGWGIFTTIRIYEGQAFAFERRRPPRCPVARANKRAPNARSTSPGT